jgi:hypothetical protein
LPSPTRESLLRREQLLTASSGARFDEPKGAKERIQALKAVEKDRKIESISGQVGDIVAIPTGLSELRAGVSF